MNKFVSVLLIFAIVAAACQNQPEHDGWCYTFVFNGLSRSPEGLVVSEGTVTEVGLDSVEVGENQWSIIFEFTVPYLIQVNDIRFQIFNWTDPLVSVGAAASGQVFGQSANISGSLTEAENEVWIAEYYLDQYIAGNTVSVAIQADGPISLYELQVGGEGDLSPFGANDCAPATATPEPTQTLTPEITSTPSATITPTSTPTWTPGGPTATPTSTEAPVCESEIEIDLSEYSATSITPSDSGRTYWLFDLTDDPVYLSIPSPWPGYEFSVSGFRMRSGSYWNADEGTNRYSVDGVRVYLWETDDDYKIYHEHPFPTGGSHGSDKVTDVLDGGDMSSVGVPHAFVGFTWSTAELNPKGFVLTERLTSNHYDLGNNVWLSEASWDACRGDPISDPTATPTSTPSITHTPSPTPTRTPISGTFVYTLTPGTAAPTSWPWTTATASPWPTNTPLPVIPSNTPGPTPTPLPSSTFIPTTTMLPIPTFSTTGTPIPTWVIGDGSPMPQITAIFTGQPLPDVTIQATNLGTIPTVVHRSEVYWFLATADAQVAQLPGSIAGYIPDVSGSPQLFGYAKWVMSGVSIQELFGPTFAPHGFHAVIAVTIVIVGSLIMFGLRIIKLMLKIAIWLINAVLKLIPGMGG